MPQISELLEIFFSTTFIENTGCYNLKRKELSPKVNVKNKKKSSEVGHIFMLGSGYTHVYTLCMREAGALATLCGF